MENYLKNVVLMSYHELFLILAITFATYLLLLPILKSLISTSLSKTGKDIENNSKRRIFIDKYRYIRKMTLIIGFSLIILTLLLQSISPTVTPKTDGEPSDGLSKAQEFQNTQLEKTNLKPISTEGVRNPMNGTGDESKKRIMELTDYRNKSFSGSGQKERINVESLPNSNTTSSK